MLFLLSWLSFANEATPPADETDPDQATEAAPAPSPASELAAPDGIESASHASVQFTQVLIKRQVSPKVPKGLETVDADCMLRFFIDSSGVPERTEVARTETCSEPFAASSEKAGMRWRFYPVKVDGERVPSSFVVRVRFKGR